MKFIKEYKNQITAIVAVVLLVAGYWTINVIKIADANRKENAAKMDQARSQLYYDVCIGAADTAYWSYMKLNGTENKDGSVTALNGVWDRAEANKKTAIDQCYQQYKR